MRAYYIRLHLADVTEAGAFAAAVAELRPIVLARSGNVVSFTWPASQPDDPAEFDEQTFKELVYLLRRWSGGNPNRELTVLEERPVDVPEEFFRRAS